MITPALSIHASFPAPPCPAQDSSKVAAPNNISPLRNKSDKPCTCLNTLTATDNIRVHHRLSDTRNGMEGHTWMVHSPRIGIGSRSGGGVD
ncbi:hypothetical protein E2C01_002964 [Portunus trituberculatus]|uniref:Uncharacterized protein n=1 Tax=Portunus trituberculatus TaxID=210409 RepID=A0A5B7CLN4_PORTR|nr:hypothetical protein [Portunus trituberculatus]